MSTEARRASVPPRPDVPPHPGVPPRPATPPRPAQPPTAPTDLESAGQAAAEPPRRDPARRATPAAEPREPAAPPRTPTGRPRQQAERESTIGAHPGPAGAKTTAQGEPTSGDDFPASGDRLPSSGDGFPSAGDGFLSSEDGLPSAGVRFPSAGTDSSPSRTAPRFTDLRAQHTDAMTPPPPPASARFPDIPPQPARPAPAPRRDDGGTPPRADERPATPHTPRPAPPHDFRRAPRPTRPVTRPASSEDSRPAGPGGAAAAPRAGTAAPRPTDGEATGPAGPDGSPPTGTAGARPSGGGLPRPAGPEGSLPGGTATPAGPRRADSDSSRPAGQRVSRPAGPGSSRPADSNGSRPADSDSGDLFSAGSGAYPSGSGSSRPAAAGDFFSAGAGTRPVVPPPPSRPAGPPPSRPADPPPPSRPADPPPSSRPAGSTGDPSAAAGSASAADSAWSPLPRSWVPAPGRTRRETEAEGAGGGLRGDSQAGPVGPAVTDDGPAWSPGAAVRQPGFAVPPVPAAPPVPPVPKAPQRTDGGPGVASGPDPSLSWSAPMAPGGTLGATRPVVTFARPEGYRDMPGIFGRRGRVVAAAVCVVLGMGLIGGAVTGSWLVGDSADAAERSTYTTAGGLWHNVPVDQLFPPTVDGQGAGPGGADRTWTRIAVAPDGGCADAFDPLLLKTLAPVGCQRLLRATYTDATQSYVTTVGLLFTTADAAAMRALDTRFTKEKLADRADLMPRPYAVKGTVAAAFGDKQRAAWTVSVLTDAPVVVYAVSGWADGRVVDTPQSAPAATAAGATTAPAQAGLGNEAQGLADRIERGLRKTAVTPTEQPS
ncbi:hypothetical protein [Streptomyces sp. NBC_00015]|uniref:hypothetical protein n=1 Tax=Streptomyces sp. NBC_00015 TaxID=2903611 RepID=UPI0038675F3A